GITVSVDALGPIADNAAGIAQMSPLPEETQMATEALGSLGKATAAVAKGCAIGSAAVTTLALLFTFGAAVGLSAVDVLHVETMIGLLLGAAFPFLFSALVIKAVGRTANEMIEEVRRQFREISGLGDGRADARADYARCVGITTSAALWAMLLPGALTVVLPLAIGFIDVEALAGFLAGALVTGTLLAMFMANAGGAWDNARRLIEAGAYGGRGSGAHEAAVIGDAIGHPFKDTAGPALNVVIKLMTIISLVFASAFL
ncbi:MAG TPA: sodium/proton-translocating pyrophosphatase, partial [Acidimicrobiia bacterium]